MMSKKFKPSLTNLEKAQAASKESQFKHLDLIVSSGEIRQRFFQRCKDMNLDPYHVAIKAGITINSFKVNYVHNANPICTKSFDQEKFLKMISLVGIDIRILVNVKPFNETYVRLIKEGIIKEN
jgi:hypothetical protein